MIELHALGKTIIYDERTTAFHLRGFPESYTNPVLPVPPVEEMTKSISPSAYTFCISVSDACNLRCDYCFNKSKSGRTIDSATAISFLERMFAKYPRGEKYFVDMSGKGEPLIALQTVLDVARWCKRKQDEIRKEVLPQFVCNGTLLTSSVAKVLQKEGILFGVSLDGDKATHDLHRKDAFGRPTFDCIINNVKSIEFRDYVGCAATLTGNVFPLVETIDSLLPLFKTISFRPARGPFGIDPSAEKLWESEYERLGLRLLEDIKRGDTAVFLALMNGEDYFGRYLVRAFGTMRTLTRCDASIARFALDIDGKEYPCPACAEAEDAYGFTKSENAKEFFSLNSQALQCRDCLFKFYCGGECPLVLLTKQGINNVLCSFRRKLITIAMVLSEVSRVENPSLFATIRDFCFEKMNRYRADPELVRFVAERPEKTFTQAKLLFDQTQRRY